MINTCKNTAESTPFYKMGVTNSRMASEEFTFPRNLDNQKLIKTEDGVLPVLHSVPCDIHGIAAVDWVTFSFGQETFGEKYAFLEPEEVDESLTEAIETWLDQILFEIFGFGLAVKRDKGMHFHTCSYELQDNLGMVLYGHANKKISVQINGTGCALARKGWESQLYKFLMRGCKRPKLNRIDLAHDDFEGNHLTVDLADSWDNIDGFWCGGREPNVEHKGAWKRPNGKGRTLNIGNRDSGKFCRIYERGKKEGDVLSLWTRAEVEFKGSDRFIPFDVLLNPSPYFIGAYPCFEWLAKELTQEMISPEKPEIVKKQSVINFDKSIEIMKHQFGKYIRQFSKIIASDELVAMLSSSKDEVPKRLKFSHAAVMQSLRINQPIQSLNEDYSLFVGVPLVNQTQYKDFIHAI